ncbi:MAG TPA: TMEM165/GDT1 family protein [Nitrososphaerales archaeon]|nr:TMEM165/GDT1 family protein [Nitrososphaerales archaeon]
MVELSVLSFGTIAATLFVTELTDKDALLLLAVSTKVRARLAFSAGLTAFVITTTILVAAGSLIVAVVPVEWIRLAGGVVMIGYGIWEARGLMGEGEVGRQESRIARTASAWRVFFALVGSLALLDLAGDATEVLTVVLVAQYSAPLFVFSAVLLGLISAVAVETTLGNRLGRFFTPRRLQIGSAAVFVLLGLAIIVFGSIW